MSEPAGYASRRAHARALHSGRADPNMRWQVSFGPAGQLCFGSRTINIVDAASLDAPNLSGRRGRRHSHGLASQGPEDARARRRSLARRLELQWSTALAFAQR